MKTAIYSRFSTEKQRDASIDDQVRECERAAKGAGLEVVARYEDRGISGGTQRCLRCCPKVVQGGHLVEFGLSCPAC